MDTKIDVLKSNGTYNSRSDQVEADLFKTRLFFDSHDLLQVKYEMLRSVEVDGLSVKQASQSYGFSRQGYYDVKKAFDSRGFIGLLPSKTGPKEAYKFTSECKEFVDRYVGAHPSCKLQDIDDALADEMGIRVSTQTISNYLSKKDMGS